MNCEPKAGMMMMEASLRSLLLLSVVPAARAGCVALENVFNAEYVTPISVGGQTVVVAPDSGSLDLVVPSSENIHAHLFAISMRT